MEYFQRCLEAIGANSRQAHIFCLLHKMDLFKDQDKTRIFEEKQAELVKIANPLSVSCFRTSIWDETLYKV